MNYYSWPVTRRDTPGDLFKNTLNLVKRHGHYAAAEKILDYDSPEQFDLRELTNYEFEFHAHVNKGGSEGIYIDCSLHGNFDDSEDTWVKVGTFKTLQDDVEAFKIMGELAGAMVAYCDIYVNANADRYTPEEERKSMMKQIVIMDKERLDRFHALFSAHNPETTRHWLRFLLDLTIGDRDQYKPAFDALTERFGQVTEEYGPEIAQALYHNIWALGIKPRDLPTAARYLHDGHTVMELLEWAEKGML